MKIDNKKANIFVPYLPSTNIWFVLKRLDRNIMAIFILTTVHFKILGIINEPLYP